MLENKKYNNFFVKLITLTIKVNFSSWRVDDEIHTSVWDVANVSNCQWQFAFSKLDYVIIDRLRRLTDANLQTGNTKLFDLGINPLAKRAPKATL